MTSVAIESPAPTIEVMSTHEPQLPGHLAHVIAIKNNGLHPLMVTGLRPSGLFPGWKLVPYKNMPMTADGSGGNIIDAAAVPAALRLSRNDRFPPATIAPSEKIAIYAVSSVETGGVRDVTLSFRASRRRPRESITFKI